MKWAKETEQCTQKKLKEIKWLEVLLMDVFLSVIGTTGIIGSQTIWKYIIWIATVFQPI